MSEKCRIGWSTNLRLENKCKNSAQNKKNARNAVALIDFADFFRKKIAIVLAFERNNSREKIRILARVIRT